MDNAVALVESYLQVNGYFTIAEYPVIEALEQGGYRTMTDLDILAFRFPHAGRMIGRSDTSPSRQGEAFAPDPDLGVPSDRPDMLIGEVKEGKAELNRGAQDEIVLRVALRRFGCTGDRDVSRAVRQLMKRGRADLESGYRVRMVAFGSSPPADGDPPFQVVLLSQITTFLQDYIRQHWNVLHHAQFKDQVFGMLVTLEKARRAAFGLE